MASFAITNGYSDGQIDWSAVPVPSIISRMERDQNSGEEVAKSWTPIEEYRAAARGVAPSEQHLLAA